MRAGRRRLYSPTSCGAHQKPALLFCDKAAAPAMILRQLFDSVSGTYSYLLASRAGGEALILDPVLEKVDRSCQLLRELDLRLVKAVDTQLHAAHVTALGGQRDR